ncbi:ATP-dependent DNA helicase RecG [Bacteroidia bacterium]|nr:ATP-dependent DNA helicase RecG [Bacteroidia bacterium]
MNPPYPVIYAVHWIKMINFVHSIFLKMTVPELIRLKESEDKVEFKQAKVQFAYNSGRKCALGYVAALANEKGGYLVLGIREASPHEVCGSLAWEGLEGKLEQDIYRDLKIRVQTEVLYEEGKRILIIKVPSRPVGKPLYFEDVALMRVGESLTRMSEEMYFSIIQEQEPDFSAKICEGLTLSDLHDEALLRMKTSYAKKQENEIFLQISNEQMLSDLKLSVDGKMTYAALILLGKSEKIYQYLSQSRIVWEFRNTEGQIHYDRRDVVESPFLLGIDTAWKLVDQPTLNLNRPIQVGPYIYNVYDFNESVIRESILNSCAHRDFTLTSDIVIKQYPQKIEIINPGGFPKGVTIDNILTVSSTPRNKLIAEILEKTGLVERSGQGVDKIYSVTLSEGKKQPDYSDTNLFQVTLRIRAEIVDKAFYVFIQQYQHDKNQRLGAEQIITLSKIKAGNFQNLNSDIVQYLIQARLIKKVVGSAIKYTLSDEYFKLLNEDAKIAERYIIREIDLLLEFINGNKKKIGTLEKDLSHSLNRNQIKYLLQKLQEDGIIEIEGKGRGTVYLVARQYENLDKESLITTVIGILKEKYTSVS